MRKLLVVMLLAIFAASLAGVSLAQDCCKCKGGDCLYGEIDADTINYENTAVNKLGRGVINTATAWAEIPAEVAKVSRERDPLLGATLGVVEGTITGVIRGVSGLIDAFTFFMPPYDKPCMKPEYALTRADREFKEYLW